MLKNTLIAIGIIFGLCQAAQGAIKTEAVEYTQNGETMEGFLAYDDAQKSPRPGVMIVHDFMGLGAFAKEKAEKLAKEGYVAFAVDVYGKGIRPMNAEEATKLSSTYKNNRPLVRARMNAAYDNFIQIEQVNPKKIMVMGYCFGGMGALELARSGTPLAGTATFHGTLSNPTPKDAKNIHGRVLIMHGAEDPLVDAKEVQAFKDEMTAANIKFKFIAYPGAVHAFTNPNSGHEKGEGVAYNAKADKQSWQEFEKFLKEIF